MANRRIVQMKRVVASLCDGMIIYLPLLAFISYGQKKVVATGDWELVALYNFSYVVMLLAVTVAYDVLLIASKRQATFGMDIAGIKSVDPIGGEIVDKRDVGRRAVVFAIPMLMLFFVADVLDVVWMLAGISENMQEILTNAGAVFAICLHGLLLSSIVSAPDGRGLHDMAGNAKIVSVK